MATNLPECDQCVEIESEGVCHHNVPEDNNNTGLFGLPWVDVIFSRIFSYLSLLDISRCRRVSKTFNELCLYFFKCSQTLDCSPVARRITEHAVVHIASETSNLRVLILEDCKTVVRDAIMIELLENNHQLWWLNLSRCTSLSNRCLVEIGVKCPQLRKLYLRECRWVSPQGVINVALSSKNLEVVDLSGCWDVDDDCITILVSSCRQITHLYLNGCYGITDLSLRTASQHLSKLTSLELDGCWRISNHAIQLIGEYCHRLKFLGVKDCRDITPVSLAKLWAKGVYINGEAAFSHSMLREMSLYSRPAMHMVPFV